MIGIRGDELLREARLKELNRIESGVVQATLRTLRLGNLQITRERKLTLSRLLKDRDARKQEEIVLREHLQAFFNASPHQLAESRQDDVVNNELVIVNDELMKWLAKHPEHMRELSPRKFEEVIAEIMKDFGFVVELTPCTRDGGRDVIAVIKTVFGKFLVIIECKRWLPPNKVGLAVVERFLHVLLAKEKATFGIIAATTSFTMGAKKSAQEYLYQLKLADFDQIKEMAKNYGTWHKKEGREIWVPSYAAL